MLIYFRLKHEIQETKHIVSFYTYEGIRVDISKKFLKKEPIGLEMSGRWYFTKRVYNLKTLEYSTVKTFINLGSIYVAECKEPLTASDITGLILTIQDIVSLQELNTYRGINHVEETYRS